MSSLTLLNFPKNWRVRWLAASGLGWLIGNWISIWSLNSLLHIAEALTLTHDLSGAWVSTISALLRGAFTGTIIGILQWVALQEYIIRVRLWIVRTAFCWSFAHIMFAWTELAFSIFNRPVPILAPFTVIGVTAGLSLGALQWALAKDVFGKQFSWILISTTSWSIPFSFYAILSIQLLSLHPQISIELINTINFFIFDITGLLAALITILLVNINAQEQSIWYKNQGA